MTFNSKFGFGCMRLPLTDEKDPTSIDHNLFREMVDIFMDKGFDYFDTSYAYHGGASEVAIRKALVERYPRESYRICDKMPTWALTCEEDHDKFVGEMLERLNIEYFDVFLIHNINTPWLEIAEKYNTFDYVKKMKEKGIAKKIGISFHEKSDLLREVLEKYGDFLDIVQLQLNYLDWEDHAIESRKCYEICVEYDKDIYVMEPLKGGVIINTHNDIKEAFHEFDPTKTIANFALRFCASLEQVKIVLSGMNNLHNLLDNCHTYETFEPLNEQECEFLEEMALRLHESVAVHCSECGYCMEFCSENIPIQDYFNLYNSSKNQPEANIYRLYFDKLEHEKVPIDKCNSCETCLDYCTQQINIPKVLKDVHDHFMEGFTPYDNFP